MMVYLTRRYRFSAGHRLHNDALSGEENRRVYGKCNNPNGHGHNYLLEVTVAGPIDPATGMVFDMVALDGIVAEHVLEKFDHKNLNLDVENFRTQVPTTENLCLEISKLLRTPLEEAGAERGLQLDRVGLEETSLNSFECVLEHAGREKGKG
ncbi:MAG: 6-carboxytetrahydropterin synthase [Terriglobia bacterium]|jgi:6-pyruvoyltetrahydropterin/6-carboxytetrahydropterin synthase